MWQQVITLLGVVIGAAGSYVTTSRMERTRWRQNQAIRWDEKRLTSYVEYASTTKRTYQLALRICAGRNLPAAGAPLSPEEGLDELANNEMERQTKWESVILLGSPDVISAARRWHIAVWKIERYARGIVGDTTGFERDAALTNRAREDFYRATREDLGVRSGQVPRPDGLEWAHASLMSNSED